MNTYSQNQDEFILQYLDGQLPMKDKVEFENTLKTDGQLQERFYQLKVVHESLRASKLETPGHDFTARVMRNLSQAPARIMISPKNGLMLLLGIGVALMLGVIFLSTGTFDQITGVLSLDKLNVPKTIVPESLPAIPFNGSLIMKILVGLNLAIAFVLIDKTILQPYFRNRNKRRLI
jgi:hypothetical protein